MRPRPPARVRYGYALLSIGVALVATLVLRSFDLEGFIFVIAVAVAVWLGGRGPGLVALLLSLLLLHFVFIAPSYTGAMPHTYVYFIAFSVLALVITGLTEARHRADQALIDARDDLEAKVQERTAELQRSNEQLRDEVAERKRAEEALRQQADLLEQTHDAIIVWGFPRTIVYWNRGAQELYGFAKDEAIGRITHELLRTEHPMPIDVFEALIQRQRTWTGQLKQTTRDGRNVVVDSRQLLVDAGDGRRLVLETNRDITEHVLASDALRKTQTALAHATRLTTLGEVTASIAHELNQPLGAIANNANACLGMLPDGRPDLDEVRDALADIVSDADRASAVIERVRALAKPSATAKVLLRLGPVVDDVVALAAAESVARRVTIRTEVAGDLPVVMGDRVQLQQVLLNLVVNGMDAMSGVAEEERLLEIRGRSDTEDAGPIACISVHDHGIGFEAGQMERLFEAFYTTKSHGMGMGLAISRSIIEGHGGRLWAESNQGPGATFSFSLAAAGLRAP